MWLSVLYVGPIVVKMCRLSATNLSRRIGSSLGRGVMSVLYVGPNIVKMCCPSATKMYHTLYMESVCNQTCFF